VTSLVTLLSLSIPGSPALPLRQESCAGSLSRLPRGLVRGRTLSARAEGGARKPWDFPRFVKTVATFSPPPNPLKIMKKIMGQEDDRKISLSKGQAIWTTANPLGISWAPLDDVVMGGVSRSTFRVEADAGRFSGFIDEANNGGFTGVRTLPLDAPLDLSSCSGIQLRVKGDGKRYKCVIRDSPDFNGITWTAEFDTRGGGGGGALGFAGGGNGWQTVRLPLSSFVATRFARLLDGETLDSSQIWAIQLVLSKYAYDGALNPNFKPGDMELVVQAVETY